MEIKLIAMDLDGTALQNDHHSFSPRLCAALEQAHQRGICIVPATGRPFDILPPPLTQAQAWLDHMILCNGAQTRSLKTGYVSPSLCLEPPVLRDLLGLARELSLPIEFSSEGRMYVTAEDLRREAGDPTLTFHLESVMPQHGVTVPSLEDLCPTLPVEKVNLLCVPQHLRDTVDDRLGQMPLSAVWAGANNLEISHPGATKGSALTRLCRELHIPMEQVMTMGDSGNDISMLRAAGLGIAMGNAPEAVRAAADAVTARNDQDGAAIAIERYALDDAPEA